MINLKKANDHENPVLLAGIEAERQLVEANRKLIEIYERKIQTKLAELWGERTGA